MFFLFVSDICKMVVVGGWKNLISVKWWLLAAFCT